MLDETVCGYAVHPACAMLPMMSEASLAEMAEDIRVNGQQQPVVTHRGLLLDGRNRLKACEIAGVTPIVEEWEGEDAVRWVLSLNFHRRHLTDSQKSIVGARAEQILTERAQEAADALAAEEAEAPDESLVPPTQHISAPEDANLEVTASDPTGAQDEGAPTVNELPPPPAPSRRTPSKTEIRKKARESAAALVNVSPNAIARGKRLIDNAVPELVGAVARGTVTLTQATHVAKLDSETQRTLAEQGDQAIVEEASRIQKSRAARPSPAKALTVLDRLCPELTIRKSAPDAWSVEGRLYECDEQITQEAETLKEALINAWAQAQALTNTEE